jgi:hypothetical protein
MVLVDWPSANGELDCRESRLVSVSQNDSFGLIA